ncbi:MAG: 3-oxoacyl-ACP reductase FabG [Chloroflexi bacterium]|nr:3-oxoacyl-ACP reductase FabG [Chloroflexota bacterium]
MTDRLKDKVCLITGGGRGLGKAMALAFAKEGARAVAISYVSNEAYVEETYAQIAQFGCTAYMTPVEVTDRDSIRAWVGHIADVEGQIDVLVNNAGINRQGPIDTVTEKDWDEIMAVNLKGPFLVAQEVLPLMVEAGGGRIINIASVSGLYGGPTTAHYAASKAGLISLTQVLARWGAQHNILVNSISPGMIETDLTSEELRSGGGAGVVALTLLKRPGQVDDVSSIAVMLASNKQNYMTGQTISPNGGSYFTD